MLRAARGPPTHPGAVTHERGFIVRHGFLPWASHVVMDKFPGLSEPLFSTCNIQDCYGKKLLSQDLDLCQPQVPSNLMSSGSSRAIEHFKPRFKQDSIKVRRNSCGHLHWLRAARPVVKNVP